MGEALYSTAETFEALSCHADLLCDFNTERGDTFLSRALALAGDGYRLDEGSAHNLTKMSSLHRDDNLGKGSFVMTLPRLIREQSEVVFRIGS